MKKEIRGECNSEKDIHDNGNKRIITFFKKNRKWENKIEHVCFVGLA